MSVDPGGSAGMPDHDRSAPLLGTAPSRRSSRWSGFSLTRPRLAAAAAIVVLVVVGSLLPYLSMPYVDFAAQPAHFAASLFPAATFIRGIDPLWLPGFQPGPAADQMQVALTVFNLGPSLQQIGAVLSVVFLVALFQDEVNKFLWWPLHLSGWLLALAPVALFLGLRLLHAAQVEVSVQLGWLPLALAGVVVLVATFRSHSRMDTYGSI